MIRIRPKMMEAMKVITTITITLTITIMMTALVVIAVLMVKVMVTVNHSEVIYCLFFVRRQGYQASQLAENLLSMR